MTQTINNGREIWIDNLKGICLILIIIGHLGAIPKSLSWLIAPTDMLYVPLFFYLSGYLYRNDKYSFKEFLIRKYHSLLVPYIAITIAVSLLDWNLYLYTVSFTKETFIRFIMGDGAIKGSPLWFVSTLFCANIVLKIGYLIKKPNRRHLFFLSLPFLCYYFYYKEIRLPLCIDRALGAAFVMYIPSLTKTMSGYVEYLVLPLSFILMILGLYSGIGLLNYNTSHTWLSFPAAIGGCIFVSSIFKRYVTEKLPPPIWIAKQGMSVLGFHCLIVFYYQASLALIKIQENNDILFFIIKLIIVFGSLYFVLIPILKRFYPKLWGLIVKEKIREINIEDI